MGIEVVDGREHHVESEIWASNADGRLSQKRTLHHVRAQLGRPPEGRRSVGESASSAGAVVYQSRRTGGAPVSAGRGSPTPTGICGSCADGVPSASPYRSGSTRAKYAEALSGRSGSDGGYQVLEGSRASSNAQSFLICWRLRTELATGAGARHSRCRSLAPNSGLGWSGAIGRWSGTSYLPARVSASRTVERGMPSSRPMSAKVWPDERSRTASATCTPSSTRGRPPSREASTRGTLTPQLSTST